jgi:hypothetical protein
MLRVVFGWENDIEELIRDERKYFPNSTDTSANIDSGTSFPWRASGYPSIKMAWRHQC